MVRTAGKAAQRLTPPRLRPRLRGRRPRTNGAVAGRPPPHLPPDWPAGIGLREVLDGCRPENAAQPVARQLVGEAPVEGGLLGGGRKHKEDVGIVGFAPALEVADVVPRLSAKALDGLGSPVPLEEERDLAARDQVTAPPVWRGGVPSASVFSESSPAAVFAHPVIQAFAGNTAAADGQRHEERVGPEVVPDIEAVIPSVLAQADEQSGVLTEAGGKHARPPRRKQQQRVESGPARRFDHQPAVEESVILEPFDPSLGDTSTREEELLDLIAIEIPVIG